MNLENAVAYVVDIEFVWGYQTTIAGLTKSAPSYTYPPPTTLIGALAEAIARSEGLGENSLSNIMNALTKDLIALALRPIDCVPVKYQDISRVIAVRESGGRRYPSSENVQGSFDAPARGKTVLVSLNNKSPSIEWVLAWVRNPVIRLVSGGKVSLDVKHFWRIHRVGSKESIASVVSVRKAVIEDVKLRGLSKAKATKYSFPLKAVSMYEPAGGWVIESYVNPFKPYVNGESPALRYLKGDVIPYASPLPSAPGDEPVAWVKPSEQGALLSIRGLGIVVGVVKE